MFALIAIIMAQLSDYRPSGIFTTAQPKILFTVLIGPFRFSKGVGIPTPKEKKKKREESGNQKGTTIRRNWFNRHKRRQTLKR
jgi:hypothetical protein